MALFPMHIATRGLLDGEYGKATRGYIICPDIVPRFSYDASVDVDGSWARISAMDAWASIMDHPLLSLGATTANMSLMAMVLEVEGDHAVIADAGREAFVTSVDEFIGDASNTGLIGSVGTDRDIGNVTDEDGVATVVETSEVIGGSDDGPPVC